MAMFQVNEHRMDLFLNESQSDSPFCQFSLQFDHFLFWNKQRFCWAWKENTTSNFFCPVGNSMMTPSECGNEKGQLLNNWFWDVAHLICDCPPWIPLSKHHIYALISFFLHSVGIATVSEIDSVQQLGKYHLEIQVLSKLLLAGSEEDLWKCLPHSQNELLLLDLLFWGQGNVSVDGFWYKRSGTVFHNFRNFVGGFSAFQGDWHYPSKSIRDVKSEN